MISKHLKVNYVKSPKMLIGCLLLLLLRLSICHGSAIGDQFESFDAFVVANPDDIFQITSDLVNKGNILILTRSGELYTTADHYYFAELNKDYNLTSIPQFVQISTKLIFHQPSTDYCLCQLDRISKQLTPVHPWRHCGRNCDNRRPMPSSPDWDMLRLFTDVRNSSFVFTVILPGDPSGDRRLLLRQYTLSGNVRDDEQRVFSDLVVTYPTAARPRRVDFKESYNLEQIDNYLYTAVNERILRGILPPLHNFDAYDDDSVSFHYMYEENSGGFFDTFSIDTIYTAHRIVKVNSTTFAMTAIYGNWTRLWNISTNKTTSICLVEEEHRVHVLQTASLDCPESSLHIRGVNFANDSLYLRWHGGWDWTGSYSFSNLLGRIYHLPSEDKVTTDLMVRKDESLDKRDSPATTTVVYSVSGVAVLGLLAGVFLTAYWWRCRRNSHSNTRDGQMNNSTAINTGASRPLPTMPITTAIKDETECYDMPYVDEGEFYDMIGDQDYDIINNDETSETTDHGVFEEKDASYSDQIQAAVSCETSPQAPPQAAAAKLSSNLDNYGYLKPRHQHNSNCKV